MSERSSARMRDISIEWLARAAEFDHLFQTRWLGERFFHLPGDMLAIQELVWRERPDCIVQTGVAAGGGVVFSASMLALTGDHGRVIAVEPRLRDEVKTRLREHRLGGRITLIEGDSCADATLAAVREQIPDGARVMSILDLTHTHAHVLRELECYAPLVSPGSYAIVMDTIMEYLPAATFEGKPYGRGNNPATAVRAFLAADHRFEADLDIEDRVLMTLSPGGFLRRVR
ncbi:cephalosporin hydroxylase family protein [Burkholderia glumae]|uniref:Cephalosporin hydroxylase family protein n=2 Tax=Burkholderia glumae TaxID=337 RepID=A0AAP9XXD5_BURGL|nr:CmcI family methyltransferase [Burkholderia glumae]ACR31105.1 Cephalosporin hydroxylase [Burkholderia glumae BGR1]AJY63486.1 cephalosporin hydroxylase family protein [Burkholderia glumae LMG 2196 = ATCC 33617]KHJ61578.1 cephalosporin hydroxylase [Burkholderia glumae]NVE24253.1 cephalosporin hydroxylase family protein [Burkholderia glumae]PJO20564.1 cephalosporin hydroxylase [Burkholderia glumae AU6208]